MGMGLDMVMGNVSQVTFPIPILVPELLHHVGREHE